jgi:uncharacterized protein YgbK (DUF1537 family)
LAEMGVIADDLTGANDTGVQFSKQGLKTIVLTHIQALKEVCDQVDVIVLDTESRTLPNSNAYDIAREAATRLIDAQIPIIYKKIDSTLKGNIGVELDAIMDATAAQTVVVAPAFPANKRVTVGGYQLVNQIPVGMTEASKDPITPVTESHVPTLLASQSRRKVEHVGLAAVMDASALKRELSECVRRGAEIIVVDSITQNDLKRVAHAVVELKLHGLTCGPAGLAEELPEALGFISGRPVITVSGSISEVTMKQIASAETTGCIVLELDTLKILDSGRDLEIKRITEETGRIVSRGDDVIISSARSKNSVAEDFRKGEALGISGADLSNLIGSVLGEIASQVAKIQKLSGIVLTGGTTAMRAFELMEASGTQVDDEVSPGIPSAIVVGGDFDGLRIVTKAGAFGDDEAITRSIRYLKRKGGR